MTPIWFKTGSSNIYCCNLVFERNLFEVQVEQNAIGANILLFSAVVCSYFVIILLVEFILNFFLSRLFY